MKKHTLFAAATGFIMALGSCSKEKMALNEEQASAANTEMTEPEPPSVAYHASLPGTVTVPILAGQNIPVGNLTISNDQYLLYVTYEMTGDYQLSTTHLYAGSREELPDNNAGNPIPGRFHYKTNHNPAVSTYTYTIPLSGLNANCYIIAAHCVVTARDANGNMVFNETGWSQGTAINPGGNWAMYTDYCTYFSDNGGD